MAWLFLGFSVACFALNFLAHGKISDLSVYGTAYGWVYEKLTDERGQRKGEREEREKERKGRGKGGKEGTERREGEKRKSTRMDM